MQTVLITGASRGIGAALAREFAAHGYPLALNCRQQTEALEHLAQELRATYRIPILTCVGNVGDPAFVRELFDQTSREIGPVSILINNAGISHIGLLQDMSYEQWRAVMNTNTDSVFLCCKHAIPDMLSRGHGYILNISSVWGNVGASCECAYSSSKGAVNAFTKALARELAPSGITVNAIACGAVDTDMNACFSPEERAALEQEIPCGRYGTPQEVASLAYQLVNAGSYLTGQIITLDGAWT